MALRLFPWSCDVCFSLSRGEHESGDGLRLRDGTRERKTWQAQ
jgi:hypothetical protein